MKPPRNEKSSPVTSPSLLLLIAPWRSSALQHVVQALGCLDVTKGIKSPFKLESFGRFSLRDAVNKGLNASLNGQKYPRHHQDLRMLQYCVLPDWQSIHFRST